MSDGKTISLPSPIIDAKENSSLKNLTERYERLVKPRALVKIGGKAFSIIPQPVKDARKTAKNTISEQKLFIQCMKIV